MPLTARTTRNFYKRKRGICPWCKKSVTSGIKVDFNWWHRACYRKRIGDAKIPKTYAGDRG